MVNIKLDSSWSLGSDSSQWILFKEGRAQTFHSSIENAINSYFDMKLRTSEARTIGGLIEFHKHLRTTLNKALTPLKIEEPFNINERRLK